MFHEAVVRVGADTSAPDLSVLTPFYRDDPTPLLERLAAAPPGVEFVLLDDGSDDGALIERVLHACERTGVSARVVVRAKNEGRAAARNRLIAEARGRYVLFLDADMLPDRPNFLLHWLSVARCQAPDVAFGGLSLRLAEPTKETALHYNLFAASDCRDADTRARSPAQSTASGNLLVRRDFLDSHPFDESFAGWGFEDTDWALTAARDTEILHVDNPATHAGLDSAEALLRKGAEAAPNFARLAAKHPQTTRFAAYRAAQLMKHVPLRRHIAAGCAWVARDPLEAAPMLLRRAALKLYRVTQYAEHLP
jgi:glycosyltransferase involved in cell wall biosynthesis